MRQEKIVQVFSAAKAILTDTHVVYTSGKHGDAYVNKDAIYPNTKAISLLASEIAEQFEYDHVDVVIAPAIGGVILSQWVAHHLTEIQWENTLSVYAEKSPDGNEFVIRRGYDKLITGKRVLVVEDVLTTGGSAKRVIEAVRAIGGNVIGLGALCNRGGITRNDLGDIPRIVALINITLESWDEEDCPLCKLGIPINTDVGKGAEFLARHKHSNHQ